jgi:hypothetical protein
MTAEQEATQRELEDAITAAEESAKEHNCCTACAASAAAAGELARRLQRAVPQRTSRSQ